MKNCDVNARTGIIDPGPAASMEFDQDMQCLPTVHSVVFSHYTIFTLGFET